jgi:hypothetical protein
MKPGIRFLLAALLSALVAACTSSTKYYGLAGPIDADSRDPNATIKLTSDSGSELDSQEGCYDIIGKIYLAKKNKFSTPGEESLRKMMLKAAANLGAETVYGFHSGDDQVHWAAGGYIQHSDKRWATGVAVRPCSGGGSAPRKSADFIISVLPPLVPDEYSRLLAKPLADIDEQGMRVYKAIGYFYSAFRCTAEKKGYHVDFPTQVWPADGVGNTPASGLTWEKIRSLSRAERTALFRSLCGQWSNNVLLWFAYFTGDETSWNVEDKLSSVSCAAIYSIDTGEWTWLLGGESSVERMPNCQVATLPGFADRLPSVMKAKSRFSYKAWGRTAKSVSDGLAGLEPTLRP